MEHSGTLGDRLTQAMKRRGLKNPDVANRLGVHVVTVSKWRSDRQLPDDESLLRLAGLLEVSPAWLRYGAERESAADSEGGSVRVVRQDATSPYGLSSEDLAKFDPTGRMLIRLPPPVYEVMYPLLFDLEAGGASQLAIDKVHAMMAELYAGVLTPGHAPIYIDEQIADAGDAVRFFRAVYERRGVLKAPSQLGEDPDAVSGVEFTKQLQSQRKKPKAG